MEEDENLGIHARLASSLKRECVVHATFFSFFYIYMRSSVYYKKQSTERETHRERGENASCVKQARRLMRTNVLLNRVS